MEFFRNLLGKPHEESVSSKDAYLIVGLGNPGREFRDTRHNIGFLVIDKYANAHEIKLSRVQNQAITGSGKVVEKRVILVKPQTFMNLSGNSVSAFARYYKILPENLIVIHDDVDLPFGTIRMRPGGGSAGQKGVASIIEKLGTQDFPRLRMGIGRPPGRMDAAGYVLQEFSKMEKEYLEGFLYKAVNALDCYIDSGLEAAMNKFNGADPT